jgi:hypothetical protein
VNESHNRRRFTLPFVDNTKTFFSRTHWLFVYECLAFLRFNAGGDTSLIAKKECAKCELGRSNRLLV